VHAPIVAVGYGFVKLHAVIRNPVITSHGSMKGGRPRSTVRPTNRPCFAVEASDAKYATEGLDPHASALVPQALITFSAFPMVPGGEGRWRLEGGARRKQPCEGLILGNVRRAAYRRFSRRHRIRRQRYEANATAVAPPLSLSPLLRIRGLAYGHTSVALIYYVRLGKIHSGLGE
jgi:hypothetical protein